MTPAHQTPETDNLMPTPESISLFHRAAPGQAGMALVMVLWFIVLLSVISFGLSSTGRSSAQMAGQLAGSSEARHHADAAMQLVLVNLLSASEAERLVGDGSVYRVLGPDADTHLILWDESGKIDINFASEELLQRLFSQLELSGDKSRQLAGAIADWRDDDDLVRLHGAESDDYLAAGLTYGPANDKFNNTRELAQVLGMEADILRAAEPYLTVYTSNSGINPEVAPLLVLLAASEADATTIENYVKTRQENFLAGLTPPSPPAIPRHFLATERGITFKLSALATGSRGVRAGQSMVFRLSREGSGHHLQTIRRWPYVEARELYESMERRQQ
ncbi:MAG TPA: hypothetical protein DCZ13_02180 [Porticoccaceae bacterium]|nr:hypothetical protein [Porticoccaceae bacterium]